MRQFGIFIVLAILLSACSLKLDTSTTPTRSVEEAKTQVAMSTLTPVSAPSNTPTSAFTATRQPTQVIQPTQIVAPTSIMSPSPSISPTNSPTPLVEAQVAEGRGGLRLRTHPSTDGNIIQNLNELTNLTILGRTEDNQWVRVMTEYGVSGWVMAQFLDFNPNSLDAGSMNTTAVPISDQIEVAVANPTISQDSMNALVIEGGEGLRLRSAPSTQGTIITNLDEYAPLTITAKTYDNKWLNVSLSNGQTGWVMSRYVNLQIAIELIPILELPDYSPAPVAPTNVPNTQPQVVTAPTSGSYISGVTSNSVQIFSRGQALGNRANIFSKVGDSVTATWPYLYPIGWGQYNLRDYSYLGPALRYFQSGKAHDNNSFASVSMAARGGWHTYTILDPAYADVPPCQPGEAPIACEYRLLKPSIAIIMIGTNDTWDIPAEQFQANLQRIIDISIERGVIPVLSTIPPSNLDWDGKVGPLNSIIISLARGYDIPLIDYHSAVMGLPNRGISEDGVHPSAPPGEPSEAADFSAQNLKYGFTVRNLLTLQALDIIWRQVISGNAASVDTTYSLQELTCPGSPPTRLAVGQTARVTQGAANNFRSGPSMTNQKIGEIPGGASFTIVSGPECGSGLTYWEVQYAGQQGWTAEGRGSTYWLEPN